MPVPSTIGDLSDNPALNSPAGSDQIAGTLDDYLRAIQAIVKKQILAAGSISAAATLAVPAAGSMLDVTGTATVQQIANTFNGRVVILRFTSAGVVLQHSGSLLLPGGANVTTMANDFGVFVQVSAGVWGCAAYSRATNADTVDGYHAGNGAGQVAVSNGTLCTSLDADTVDGKHAAELQAWGNITGKPTTVSDYGITDMGSQSVNYANSAGSAGNADTVDGKHAAELQAWGNITGKPSDFVYNNGGTYSINVIGSAGYAGSAGSAGYAGSAGNADTLDGVHVSQLVSADSNLAVGCFALLRAVSGAYPTNPGDVRNGSDLRYTGVEADTNAAAIPPGQWRCCGYARLIGSTSAAITLFQRIS